MPVITLDLETLPTDRQDVREYIANTVKPPATMSKAETIAKWILESKADAVDEAVSRTGLDGSFGRVCVIGWALDDHAPASLQSADNESWLLHQFSQAMASIPLSEQYTTLIVGHNVAGFDLRFLMQRFIVNGIKPPLLIQRAAQAKPWEAEKVFDTMVQWSGAGAKPGGSLDKLCLALGIPSPKGDIDGSKVAAAVAAGRIDDVAAYCRGDVSATRAVYRRMTFQEPISLHVLAACATEVA